MSEELFVDGIGEVVITGMVVRIDFMTLDPSKRDEHGRPTPGLRQRVVMPIDSFVRAAETLSGTLKKMESLGVIKKKAGGGVAVEAAPSAVN